MRSPRVGKPRTANVRFALSGKLPRLNLPASSLSAAIRRVRPRFGKPPRSAMAMRPPARDR